ncbi:hypothetical protein [Microbispora rosea]|uniref:MmyB family transcriptional regulator n=1 Tax=Microbispora rosea TaxID=58117 RepID=UPI003D94AB9D
MEQGREVRPSDEVLDAIASALDLGDEERRTPERVPDSTRRLLHVMNTPAVVLGRHLDVLAWNTLAEALLGDPDTLPPGRRNMLLALFEDPGTRARCPDWETTALQYIGMLRAAVATDPSHPRAYPLPGDPGPVLLVHTAEPGTADAERLRLLAPLRATRESRKAQAERPGLPGVVRRQGPGPRSW